MAPHPCPRCGFPVTYSGRGRPPRWCSDECRRRGHESGVQVRDIVRERVLTREIHVPHNPVSAAGVVLEDVDAVRALLQQLGDQLRHDPTTTREFIRQRQLLGLSVEIAQLGEARRIAQARRDAREKPPELTPAAASPAPTVPKVPTEAPPAQSPTPPARQAPTAARGKGQKNGKGQKKKRHSR